MAAEIPLYQQRTLWHDAAMGRHKVTRSISFNPDSLALAKRMARELGYDGNLSRLIDDLIHSAASSTEVITVRRKGRAPTRLFVQRPAEPPPP